MNFAIRDKTGLLLGGLGFERLAIRQSHQAEIGYWLARPYWGRGVRAACRHAFAQFGLEKVVAHVFAQNLASARVLKKTGFQEEGFLRRHHRKDGQFIDARFFGLLREEIAT